MADVTRVGTVIGRGTRIRGRVSGSVDLELAGHVEGEITVDGDLTVVETGTAAANLSARRIVVRGAVRGDLVGEESVALEDGARVVGDVRAPRVSVAHSAFVRGYVQTEGAEGAAPRSRAAAKAAAAPPVAAPSTPRHEAPRAAPAPAPAPAARPAPPPAPVRAAPPPPTPISKPILARAALSLAGGRPASDDGPAKGTNGMPSRTGGPPPPVVPALKKGVKGTLQKKRG